jgi:O-antigen/teichoic acid export membrane protein
MTPFDRFGVALLLSLVLAFLVAFFLYLRTAYRRGGYREVKSAFIVAIVAIVLFCAIRIAENLGLEPLKQAVDRMTR